MKDGIHIQHVSNGSFARINWRGGNIQIVKGKNIPEMLKDMNPQIRNLRSLETKLSQV